METQELADDAGAGLHAHMGGEHEFAGGGTEAVGKDRGGAGYEAVNDDGDPAGGGAQEAPRETRDVESPHLGQDVQGVAGIR